MTPPTLQETFDLAVQHHQAGRLAEAEQLYRHILARQPGQPQALHHLGIIAHQQGRHDDAADLIGQAIAAKPNYAEAFNNLSGALREMGRLEDAATALRRALAIKPDYLDALCNLSSILREQGRPNEAVAAYERAIAFRPEFPEGLCNLGDLLREQGQLEGAIAACSKAIDLKPDLAQAHNNLGNALRENGRLTLAIEAYQRAITLRPDYCEAFNNLGAALSDLGDSEEAITAYRRAISLKPDHPEAHSNLGEALRNQGRLEEAVAACRHAVALRPNFPEALNNLGNALKDSGAMDDAFGAYRSALALKPDFSIAHSNLLFSMHYQCGGDGPALAGEHRRWARQHAEQFKKALYPHANVPDPQRRLRIGYVSPDLRSHPVGRFLLPLLAHHDPACVEVFAYADVPAPDHLTAELRTHTHAWRSLTGLSDAQAAGLIRGDRIDILVDLAGHTAFHRLLVFARKPAPVQVTFLGYPNTTGLDVIDYRFTDAWADPPGMPEALHSEALLRLAPCAWCCPRFSGPAGVPRRDGPLTFGSFNLFAKITDPMLRLWGRILTAVPGSVLLLKASALADQAVQARVRRVLAESGVEPGRVDLRGKVASDEEHLGLYQLMDIALDSFPYHGTHTTCEALSMGVPVVTLAGKTHVSRVGVSLLNNAGLGDLVAATPQEYERIAVDLANDLPRLAEFRSTLRARMEASPLMDGPRFARNVEAAYRQIWRRWCDDKQRGGSPAGTSMPAADQGA